MAVVSDCKFCLMWETERPYIGRERRSSCFRMFGEEWYLRLLLENHNNKEYHCRVFLHRLHGEKTLAANITSNCLVISDALAYKDYHCLQRTVEKSGDILLRCYPMKTDHSPSENPGSWKIICRFSCAEPLSLQINNETLHVSTIEEVDHPPKSTDRYVQVSVEVPQDINSLSSDISRLLEDEIFPDFELKCENHTFPVHRSILAARSEVFQAMFRSKMKEGETGSADIKDLEAPILQSLLKFIYSGKLGPVSDDAISKIYEASDRYAVHCLKKACCHWMKRNLTEENCLSFLSRADSHCDHDLRAAVVSFILKHPGVLKSPTWLAYSKEHHEMANEVLQTYVSAILQ